MPVSITLLEGPSVPALPHELVERKGRGHPDTLCDALAETVSRALSRHYVERFGRVLHHNVDKALLAGGAARPAFGGGEILEPMVMHLAGRATTSCEGVAIPVEEIAIEASRAWLRSHLRYLDAERDVRFVTHLRPVSADLAALFARDRGGVLANDTSLGAGYAPLDELERLVLAVEQRLASRETLAAHPEIGEDVKVMGARAGRRCSLTVACAMVGRHVSGLADYRTKKAAIRALVLAAAAECLGRTDDIDAIVNAADGDTPDSLYLTVTGLSAEAGDDGQVGRGNRVNGLITPYRPMTLEAAAGKNPVTHVGKLYNLLAFRIARALVDEIPGVREATCHLLSRIGHRIDDPEVADVKVRLADPAALPGLAQPIRDLVERRIARIDEVTRDLVAGTTELW